MVALGPGLPPSCSGAGMPAPLPGEEVQGSRTVPKPPGPLPHMILALALALCMSAGIAISCCGGGGACGGPLPGQPRTCLRGTPSAAGPQLFGTLPTIDSDPAPVPVSDRRHCHRLLLQWPRSVIPTRYMMGGACYSRGLLSRLVPAEAECLTCTQPPFGTRRRFTSAAAQARRSVASVIHSLVHSRGR